MIFFKKNFELHRNLYEKNIRCSVGEEVRTFSYEINIPHLE